MERKAQKRVFLLGLDGATWDLLKPWSDTGELPLFKQLMEKGINANLGQLHREIEERVKRDAEMAVAPLRACDDAKVIDTTGMSISEVVRVVLEYVGKCI